jgi:hypothetical protein
MLCVIIYYVFMLTYILKRLVYIFNMKFQGEPLIKWKFEIFLHWIIVGKV